MQLVGYHGTDAAYTESIMQKGFLFRKSDEHWLGNGIYFFTDRQLAEWWVTNPTSKFGSTVTSPAIIKAVIEANEDDVCDMRNLLDYNFVCEEFERFFNLFFETGLIPEDLSASKVRCAFFDYMQEKYSLVIIIGVFFKSTATYRKKISVHSYRQFKTMAIIYGECQMCVFKDSALIHKEVI